MADIKTSVLEQKIQEMLRGANLADMTTKKVRKQLEIAFNTSFEDRKKEITNLVEKIINASSESESSDEEKPVTTPIPKKVKKEEKADSSSGEDDAELARKLQEEEELKGKRATRSGGNAKVKSSSKNKKKRKKNDSSDDEPKKKRNNGYLKALLLSDELAHFMGEKELPRHEVVKRVWRYCKEKELMDPKNKQFAICDSQLMKVIGKVLSY